MDRVEQKAMTIDATRAVPAIARTGAGLQAVVRPARSSDAPLLTEFLAGLSDNTRWLRYMSPRPASPEFVRAEVSRMLRGPAAGQLTLLASAQRRGSLQLLAVGELVRDAYQPDDAELAIVVRDDAQGLGLGATLMHTLVRRGEDAGYAAIRLTMLPSNRPMLRLVRGLGMPYEIRAHAEEVEIAIPLPLFTSARRAA